MRHRACGPGDIIVAQAYGGWLLGRALEEEGPGPWWEYVGVAPEFTDALSRAAKLASRSGARVWFHAGGEEYRLVSRDALTIDSDTS
jgi:hypothetical protein